MKNIIYFLSLVVLLTTTSCSTPQKASKTWHDLTGSRNLQEIKIYFTKSKGPENLLFVPVTRKIAVEDSEVDGSLRELFLGPTQSEELQGIMSEIPVGTRLIKVEESEDEILIDVSSQYLTGGGSASMQLRYLQLYKTLKEVAPGKKLYLHVDGKNIKAIGGEGLEVSQPLKSITDYTKKPKEKDDIQP